MKLFVIDKKSKQKIYIDTLANSRSELARRIGSPWFSLGGFQYHVNEVIAETTDNSTATGAVVGGLLGLLGGPVGVLFGGILGGALGNETDKTDTQNVNLFNNSRV
ncbi:MAG: hypothetical protein ACO1PI_10255 [Bacteroidota bacterium]